MHKINLIELPFDDLKNIYVFLIRVVRLKTYIYSILIDVTNNKVSFSSPLRASFGFVTSFCKHSFWWLQTAKPSLYYISFYQCRQRMERTTLEKHVGFSCSLRVRGGCQEHVEITNCPFCNFFFVAYEHFRTCIERCPNSPCRIRSRVLHSWNTHNKAIHSSNQ